MKSLFKTKIAICLLFVMIFTSLNLTGFLGSLKEVQANGVSPYTIPKIQDQTGAEYIVDWSYAATTMKEAINKNTNLQDNLVPVKVQNKSNPSEVLWANIDISKLPNLPESISASGKTLKLNGFLLAGRGLVAYGVPEDVPGNELKNDKYRYLGYSINGDKYTNPDFPPDAVSGTHAKDKKWIKHPWNDSRVQSSKYGIRNPSPIYVAGQFSTIAGWLERAIWHDASGTVYSYIKDDGVINRGQSTRTYSTSEILHYFHVEAEPTDYTNGTIRGWHDTHGPLFYQTFTIPALYQIELVHIIPIREGDFIIKHEGEDYTDGTVIKSLPSGTQAGVTEYPINLELKGIDTNLVQTVEWYQFNSPSVTNGSTSFSPSSIGNGITTTINRKGSTAGAIYAIGAIIKYKNGTQYPAGTGNTLGEKYILHKVTIIEQNQEAGEGSGEIVFNPNSSFDIGGNRLGWVKSDINVSVTVTGETTKTANGSASCQYSYQKRHERTYCSDRDENGSCTDWDTEVWYTTEYGNASREYTEIWEIKSLKVWGSGTNLAGSSVRLPEQTINGTSGTYIISQELSAIQLQAEIIEWQPKSQNWGSTQPPNDGSWTGGSPPVGRTSKPTDKYSSNSGFYYLDKTKPVIASASPTSHNWTNQTVTVPIRITDNLSGLWRNSSFFRVIDKSYYNRPIVTTYYNHRSTDDTQTAIMSQDGIYEIEVDAEDTAQNKMTQVKYREYLIDKTNPYDARFSSDNRSYIDDDLTVTVTVGDNLSGVVETRYVLNNSPYNNSGMRNVSATTPERQEGYSNFNVHITQPGSWWIHVYQKDRAGNETWSTSSEYRLVRISDPWIEPSQMNNKVPRATRFDILIDTYGLTEERADYSIMNMDSPKWIDDAVERKVNGIYSANSGRTYDYMNYYYGKEKGPQDYATPSTEIMWWKAYIPPYGTPATSNRDGGRLRNQEYVDVYLTVGGYYPSDTHTKKVYFDVIPETKIKTEVINNPK
ncbi:Athe_2463 domain-containing protein [Alkaliphilus sp. B6464]|uniref:Athe_2463 domain-containing protein n=1 Tax=Alkaliphilus sp. B6464 TaxID=2731219 RepID=UPI001BA92AA0|nr:hypothetical protein [Alkaliphilus sp. B6464]QUH21993.1 hypothetical protein HYG84_18990 [Alkaliphilus sp. B6464]